jgi:low affinity Fe/Cu permease
MTAETKESAEHTTHKEALPEKMARFAIEWSGSSLAFGLALLVILVWLVSGPIFGFSDTWQLVINTGTTIVTFLMVFLIQRAQNKDSHAIHLKLNEMVAATKGASNRLINVEGLTEKEINLLHEHFGKLVELAKRDGKLTESHSVEEATERHHRKKGER